MSWAGPGLDHEDHLFIPLGKSKYEYYTKLAISESWKEFGKSLFADDDADRKILKALQKTTGPHIFGLLHAAAPFLCSLSFSSHTLYILQF